MIDYLLRSVFFKGIENIPRFLKDLLEIWRCAAWISRSRFIDVSEWRSFALYIMLNWYKENLFSFSFASYYFSASKEHMIDDWLVYSLKMKNFSQFFYYRQTSLTY
jgi:hypothetical protein